MPSRPMEPNDIATIAVNEELGVGVGVVAYTRRVIRRGRYESHIWLLDLVDGAVRGGAQQRTRGRVRDSAIAVSPDGQTLAFLRRNPDDDDAPAELRLAPVRAKGDGRVVRTTGMGAISELVWSPDGSRLAIVAEADPLRFIVGDRPPIGSPAARSTKLGSPTARRIDRIDWRFDEEGHRDYWSQLFVLEREADTGRWAPPRQVTDHAGGVSGVCWHPDGRTVACVSDPGPDADVAPRPRIFTVDVGSTASMRLVLDAAGGASRPAFSPDGRWLAAVGVLDPQPFDDHLPELLLVRCDRGGGAPFVMVPTLDRPIGNWADTDLNGWMVSGRTGPVWLDDSTIVAAISNRGRSLPTRWQIDRRDGRVLDGPSDPPGEPWADATTHWLAPMPGTRSQLVALGTLGGRAMEVMTLDFDRPDDDGGLEFVTHTSNGSAWQRRVDQPDMRSVMMPGDGGEIEVWVASPAGRADEPNLPTIVDVHGGPLGCWAPAPHIEVIMLTGAGYRVLLPNIRGSSGYGAAWIRPQLGDWGGVDARDVLSVVDHAVRSGMADGDRLGVMGLSYGGFMVNWLVGVTDRFTAAVSENGVTNQVSVWANSDSGPEYCRAAKLGDVFSSAGVERLWSQSPLRNVAEVRTPLLMLQAEADLRCPAADNEQFFIALRTLRREVEYVLYPDEFHVFASAGRPDRRIDRMGRVLDWFAEHLGRDRSV